MNICIIKLGADGDVLRTLPLAQALFKKTNANITWITRGDVATLLEGLPYIHSILQSSDVATMPYVEFDALYNFDTELEACTSAQKITAKKKYGFYDDGGYPAAFNAGAEYYLNTMFDDMLKKENGKTYQEMMFEVAELPYAEEGYSFALTNEEKLAAQTLLQEKTSPEKKLIGIHLGASSRWPSKAWNKENVKAFIALVKAKGHDVLLFGGPNEIASHAQLINELKEKDMQVIQNNPHNTKRAFAALVELCDVLVCADSFALHVALGVGTKTIALFFVTSPAEVEEYGLLTKLIAPRLNEFFPERSDQYDEALTKSISAEEVLIAVEEALSINP